METSAVRFSDGPDLLRTHQARLSRKGEEEKTCWNCSKGSEKVINCAQCHIATYCSKKCMKNDPHVECEKLQKVRLKKRELNVALLEFSSEIKALRTNKKEDVNIQEVLTDFEKRYQVLKNLFRELNGLPIPRITVWLPDESTCLLPGEEMVILKEFKVPSYEEVKDLPIEDALKDICDRAENVIQRFIRFVRKSNKALTHKHPDYIKGLINFIEMGFREFQLSQAENIELPPDVYDKFTEAMSFMKV